MKMNICSHISRVFNFITVSKTIYVCLILFILVVFQAYVLVKFFQTLPPPDKVTWEHLQPVSILLAYTNQMNPNNSPVIQHTMVVQFWIYLLEKYPAVLSDNVKSNGFLRGLKSFYKIHWQTLNSLLTKQCIVHNFLHCIHFVL